MLSNVKTIYYEEFFFILSLSLLLAVSCELLDDDAGDVDNDHTYGVLTDIDGNQYKTIAIGEQVWMAENLCSLYP